MAKIKYDVTDAESRRSLQPGPYLCVIDQMTDRTPDGKNDIEVVLAVKGGESKGQKIWTYLNLGEASAWKLREFTDAVGLKPKGTLDTDRLVRANTEVGIVVTADSYNGEYRGRVNKFIAPDDLEDADDEDDGEDLDDDEETVPAPKSKRGKAAAKKAVTGDDDDDDEDDDEDEDEEDYSSMTLKELRALIDERDIEATSAQRKSKDKLIELLEDDDEADDDDDDEDDDADTDVDDDDTDDDDGDDEDEEDYSTWTVAELKEELESRGLKTAGKQSALIARLEKDDSTDDKPF